MKNLSKKLMVTIALLVLPVIASAKPYDGKKVLFVDSYHQGYAWSDGIAAGVENALKETGAELKIVRLDTKRNTDEAFKAEAGRKAKAEIDSFKPDVVVAADDNAAQYVIVPYYKGGSLPFVFCGLNWDASIYGLPTSNVTGMLEVTPIPQLVDQLKPFAKGDRLGFLGPDVETARKEAQNYKKVFGMQLTEYYSTSYEDWKKGFKELQQSVDILIIDSDGGLYNDKQADMKAFAKANTTIPTGSTYDFMAHCALLTYAKVAEEQGFWAATTALKILDGTSASQIPLARNEQGKLIINMQIAEAMGLSIPFEIIQSADQVIE
jgi:ABC-type uncharacterized transport system substrate-binding protein